MAWRVEVYVVRRVWVECWWCWWSVGGVGGVLVVLA